MSARRSIPLNPCDCCIYAHHRSLVDLEAGLRALTMSPRNSGRVALIVRRRADGVRETPERAYLTPEDGVPGDGWGRRPPRDPQAQLAVMRRDVAELIANGQALTVFGDNLFVDLDISDANLPVGTRLRVGSALVEVTPKFIRLRKMFLSEVERKRRGRAMVAG